MGRRAVEATGESVRPVRRGRPPITKHRRAVLDATRRVIARTGYAELTFEAVATDAGLYRKYIQRTWRSKPELIRDALFEDVVDFDVPDTGDLGDDLRLLIRQHVELILRPEFLRGLPGLHEAFRVDRELWDETLERHVRPPTEAFAAVLGQALARGEIAGHADPEVVLNSISGAVQQLARLGLLTPDELLDHAVRMVRDGMVTPPHP